METIEERLAWLEGKSESWTRLEEIVIGQAKEIERLEGAVDELMQEKEALQEQLNFVQKQAEDAQDKCATLMRAARTDSSGGGAMKIKPPKPRDYSGARDSKEVDNFLFDMEQYFRICQLSDNLKVDTATMHLSDDAKLWWRTKHADIEEGKIKIDTWEEFKKELKDQFYPENTEFVARMKLQEIRHKGSIRDYVKEYSACMLDIRDMNEKDRLFNFVHGLQEWAQREVLRAKVDTLSAAMTAAERLMDYSAGRGHRSEEGTRGTPTSSEGPTPSSPKSARSDSRVSSSSVGGFKKGNGGGDSQKSWSSPSVSTKESKISTPSGNISRLNCLLCRGPHKWWECKHKGEIDNLQRKLSAMSVEETPKETEEEACHEDEEPRRMSSVYMMYAMGKEGPKTREESTNMMYVDLVVNGRNARAMVDTGASHNFVTETEARRLGLVLKKGGGSMKSVNSKAKPILGVAEQVEAKLGDWEGKMNFTAVNMDDFNLVLGLEFLRTSKAVVMPHLNSLLVAGGQTCLVRSTGTPTKTKEKGRFLSAMRVMEPLRKATSQIPPRIRNKRQDASSSQAAPSQKPKTRKTWIHKTHQPIKTQQDSRRLQQPPSTNGAEKTTEFRIGAFSFIFCNSCKSTRASTA